ncbi:MAG: hypothetical protein V9E94_04885 [Microthrixaceae bacterium]
MVEPLFQISVGLDGSLDERITGLVVQRLRLYDVASPVFRAAIACAGSIPVIAERVQNRRTLLARQVRELFEAELTELGDRGPEIEAAVDALAEFESIDHLRRFRGLDDDAVSAVLGRVLHALLRPT